MRIANIRKWKRLRKNIFGIKQKESMGFSNKDGV